MKQIATMNFKFSLDTSSKKFICPSCAKKRFVRYIDNQTKNYLSEEYGRCDRESSCGYHLPPTSNPTLVDSTTIKPLQPISTIDSRYVSGSETKYDENHLFQYLTQHFKKEEILQCFKKYRVGTSKHWKGATVFWQIDQNNKVRSGKIMLINPSTGKRVKEPFPHINWVHKVLELQDYNLKQCLFGEHLVAKPLQPITTIPTIAIVESEKTAITMSIFLKNSLWVATGSKQNLKHELLQSLKNYNIILFPDCGEYEDWNKKALELTKLGYTIKCSKLLEDCNHSKGTDLADIYFNLNEKSKTEITNEFQLSETEKHVQRIAKTNPSIIELINIFDLMNEKGDGIRMELIT